MIRRPTLTGVKARLGSVASTRLCICLIIVTVSLLSTFKAAASPNSERIDRVKAAFVLNIARFVSWPAEAFESQDDRLLLCLYRNHPFHQAIELIRGEMVAGRSITITHIETLAESGSCNILLIAHEWLQEYIKEARPDLIRPLLTIADQTDADTAKTQRHNILVTLVRNDKRIGFEINLNRARQSGLKLSSQLLKLATIVGDAP